MLIIYLKTQNAVDDAIQQYIGNFPKDYQPSKVSVLSLIKRKMNYQLYFASDVEEIVFRMTIDSELFTQPSTYLDPSLLEKFNV